MTINISHKEFFEMLDSAEIMLSRDGWKVSNVDVWPIVKIYYSYYILTQIMDKRGSQIKKLQGNLSKISRALDILQSNIYAKFVDRNNNQELSETEVLIFVQSSTRYFKTEGSWYSPYSDTLQAGFAMNGIRSQVCETTEDGKYLFPRFGLSALLQKKLLMNMVIAKIKSTIYPSKIENCKNWIPFVDYISENLGPEFRPNSSNINFHVNNALQQSLFFSKMLSTVKCKVCIMSGYYSSTMFGLINACRTFGVKTVEVQHGVQGDSHFAYRSWLNVPADQSNILPDYFWTWSDLEKQTIENWAKATDGRHKAFVGGNPCLTIYNRNKENVASKNNFKGYDFPHGNVSKVILFTCQASEKLSDLIIHCIRSRPDFGWIFRIHPQYWQTEKTIKAQCETEGFRNVIVDNGEHLPLSSAMQCATVHMTEFSSSVIEAAAIGLHSIVIHHYGHALYAEFFKSGSASYAENIDDILNAIDSVSSSEKIDFASLNELAFMMGISNIANIIGNE